MRFKLKVHRGARALVMLIDAPALDLDDFAICHCSERDFSAALRYAQSRVALPTFLVGGDFAIRAAEDVLHLRGVVAFHATDETIRAASMLQVPLLLMGGSRQVERAARDASRIVISDGNLELTASIAGRFIGAYS